MSKALVRLPEIRFVDCFDGSTDFVVRNRSAQDLRVEFVRVIKTEAATCGNGLIDAGEERDDGNVLPEGCVPGEAACLVCGNECRQNAGRALACNDGQVEWSYDLCIDVSLCISQHDCD